MSVGITVSSQHIDETDVFLIFINSKQSVLSNVFKENKPKDSLQDLL